MDSYLTDWNVALAVTHNQLKPHKDGSPLDISVKLILEVTQLRKELERLHSIIDKP